VHGDVVSLGFAAPNRGRDSQSACADILEIRDAPGERVQMPRTRIKQTADSSLLVRASADVSGRPPRRACKPPLFGGGHATTRKDLHKHTTVEHRCSQQHIAVRRAKLACGRIVVSAARRVG
jgi:hypothetical protein